MEVKLYKSPVVPYSRHQLVVTAETPEEAGILALDASHITDYNGTETNYIVPDHASLRELELSSGTLGGSLGLSLSVLLSLLLDLRMADRGGQAGSVL